MALKYFHAPDFEFLDQLEEKCLDDNIVVVTVIGKSDYNQCGEKTRKLFEYSTDFFRKHDGLENKDGFIKGFYNEAENMIVLQLYSELDTYVWLRNHHNTLEQHIKHSVDSSFLSLYNRVRHSIAKYILFLLHVSHILIVYHPTFSFDVSYFSMFNVLDYIREQIVGGLREALEEVHDLHPNALFHTRYAAPRVLFYFEQCPAMFRRDNRPADCSIEKLEFNIEDRIFRILRTLRIITNNSESSLFAIPANTPFVYVNDEYGAGADDGCSAIDYYRILGALNSKGLPQPQPDFPFSVIPPVSRRKRCFRNFLQKHLDLAFGEGFNDNISNARHVPKTFFMLPTLRQWVEVFRVLHNVFIVEDEYRKPFLSEESIPRDYILNVFDAETRFSNKRCIKIYPIALSKYYDNLTERYSCQTHFSRIQKSCAVLAAYAGGPIVEHFMHMAQRQFDKYYLSGNKRICEKQSLLSTFCYMPAGHEGSDHDSKVQLVSFCNCGKTFQTRKAPFYVYDANYSFYREINSKCGCHSVDFLESNHNVNLSDNEIGTKKVDLSKIYDNLEQVKMDQSLVDDESPEAIDKLRYKDKPMLTLKSPLSYNAPFPSWALVYVGTSSLYTHSMGLADNMFPGFLPGTNFLLPIDLCFKLNKKNMYRFKNYIKNRKVSSIPLTKFTVKLFIGLEYECSLGHRFMMSSPTKVLDPSDSLEKNSGLRVLRKDMPIYCSCCNEVDTNRHAPLGVAVLTRIHIVTPKAPIQISFIPMVKFEAGNDIFVPSRTKNLTLTQSSYWILKFPYYYYASDEQQYGQWLHLTQQRVVGKLAKGFLKMVHLFE